MSSHREKRREDRIRFSWPLWFGYHENGQLFRGQVVDLSRSAVSFTVDDEHCPELGQHILTRFSYPHSTNDGFDMGSYFHWSEVIRLGHTHTGKNHVALRFHQPLPSDPAATAQMALQPA